jgi:hypothetical protein
VAFVVAAVAADAPESPQGRSVRTGVCELDFQQLPRIVRNEK